MSEKFAMVEDKISFPGEEEKIMEYWAEIDAFKKSLDYSKDKPIYTFYDGPPFATGLPHYGHILAGTIKDTVTRYAHQTGHYVSRRFGWDCHGLPVEYEIDKKLGITGRDMVLKMGVDKYNAECRSIVQRYTKEWETIVGRLGRWIDFKNDYKTMDPNFMESVWWVFKTLFEKGLVYRGYKVMPYSTACATPLSNFEAGLNYKNVNDPTCVVSFPLINDPDVSFLAWTTTPWTLPSNLSLCVNPKFEYIKIIDKSRNNRIFIILEKRLPQIFPETAKADCTDERRAELYDIIGRFLGQELVGLQYEPLFPYFEALKNRAFRVLGDSYVTEEGGTGIVHQAPAFGEDDYRVCLAHGVVSKGEELPCPVDADGRFTQEVSDFAGRHVKEADNDICLKLKNTGRLVIKESCFHSYPFCWRSETPLIYKAISSWFISVESVKALLLENNTQTYWVPSFVQEKRFHNWLADAKDWAVSRNRFWGTPIPLWVSDDLEEMIPIGSVEELYQLSGVRVTDLHKESIDHITIPSKTGKGLLKRVDEVFDCWFESGSMPYAQLHYPFENQEIFDQGFPADFIAEGLDQTRGWFYTLMVISTCLFNKPAFKNLIVNGLVLASDGKKMSKRLNNYPNPQLVLDSYGADSLRLYLINSPVVRAETLKFQEDGVSEVVRGVLIPWFNAFRFFIQCVERLEMTSGMKFIPSNEISKQSSNDLDIWILATVYNLVAFVHQEMTAYRLYTVVPRLVGFIEELTNWYVRLNRNRLKGGSGEDEALTGLNVLYEVVMTMTIIMSPFTPFFTEYLYQHLRKFEKYYGNKDDSIPGDIIGKSDSIHFLMLPTPDVSRINLMAESRFKTLQTAVTLVRIARERRHIRNNLPLKNVTVVSANPAHIEALEYLKLYFVDEINAWNVTYSTDWEKMCLLKTQPNWKDLGKRLGKKMKEVAKGVAELTHEQIVSLINTGVITIAGIELTKEDLVVKREFNGDAKRYEACVSDDGSLLIAIDTTIDEEIYEDLRARQLAANIQRLRKTAGLVVQDRVEVFFEESGTQIATALGKYSNFVIQRVRSMPFPMALKPNNVVIVATEIINDTDLSKNAVKIVLTRPAIAVNSEALHEICDNNTMIETTTMYLQTLEYESVITKNEILVNIDGKLLSLKNKVHFFSNTLELIQNNVTLKETYPWIPSSSAL